MSAFSHFIRTAFAPPRYLSMPAAGIDVSASGIKLAVLGERGDGLELVTYGEQMLPEGAFVSADIADVTAVVKGLAAVVKAHGITTANIANSTTIKPAGAPGHTVRISMVTEAAAKLPIRKLRREIRSTIASPTIAPANSPRL